MRTTSLRLSLSLAFFCFLHADEQQNPSSAPRKSHESFISKDEQQLFKAAATGDTQRLEFLLKKKVNPNAKDDKGNTPIHYAKDLSTIELLLKYGSDINAQNNDGLTKLHMDVVLGKAANVQYLLTHGANVKISDVKGVSPLHLGMAIPYFESPGSAKITAGVYSAIVAAEVIADVPPTQVSNAIASVDIGVRQNIEDLLLQYDANVNVQDEDGDTPLHILASGELKKDFGQRDVAMANKLILKGADTTIRNKQGQTAADVATASNRKQLAEFLKKALAEKKIQQKKN